MDAREGWRGEVEARLRDADALRFGTSEDERAAFLARERERAHTVHWEVGARQLSASKQQPPNRR